MKGNTRAEARVAAASDDSGRSRVSVPVVAPFRPFGPPPPEGEALAGACRGAVVLFRD